MRLRVSPEKLRSIANRCEYPEDFLRRITREFGVPTNRGIDDDAYLHGLKWGLRGLDSRRQGSGVSAEFRQGHKDGVLARSHLLRNDGAWFNRALEVNL